MEQRGRQTARSVRGQEAEQGPASWNPPKRALRDLCAQTTADEVADRKRGQWAVAVEIGSQHRAGRSQAGFGKRLLKPGGWQVDDGDRVADQWQGRAYALEIRRARRRWRDGRSGRVRPRVARASGPPVAPRAARAPAEATRVGRGGRPPTSISRPGRSGSDPAQASAAAAAFEPLASPTAVTRITRPLIARPASRRRCWSRQGGRPEPRSARAAAGAPSPRRREPRPRRRRLPSRAEPPAALLLGRSPRGQRQRPRLGGAVGEGQRVASERAAAARRAPASSSAGIAASSSTVACPLFTSHRPAPPSPRPSAAACPAAARVSRPAPRHCPAADLRVRPQRRRQRPPRRRRRVATDQRRPRARARRYARRPEGLAGQRDLCRHQDRQQQEWDHRDQLDRGGPLLPVACAAGGPWRHAATVAGANARVARSTARISRHARRADVSRNSRRSRPARSPLSRRRAGGSRASVPPPLEKSSSLPAISRASIPNAP